MAKDLLLVAHEFGMLVTDSLNKTAVRPPEGAPLLCAVLTVVSDDPQSPPLGGSICYDDATALWHFGLQLDLGERVTDA
jgi:hypothetical protein